MVCLTPDSSKLLTLSECHLRVTVWGVDNSFSLTVFSALEIQDASMLVIWGAFYLCSYFETRSQMAHNHKIIILRLPPPMSWDDRYVPGVCGVRHGIQSFVELGNNVPIEPIVCSHIVFCIF